MIHYYVWYSKGPCCIDTAEGREIREYDDDMDGEVQRRERK